MNIATVQITNKIILLVFKNQYDVASTFLRFQEHYESPQFKGKIFTLNEFKKWYISLKNTPKFTYYTDWNGFNIPSHILHPFYEHKFNPLSEKEKKLLNIFKNIKDDFYIIGIHKDMKNVSNILQHETAHGLFYTDKNYYNKVLKILSEFNLTEIKKELSSKGGYHKDVLDDEVHAYALEHNSKLKTKVKKELTNKLLENYQYSLKQNNAKIPSF